MLQEVMEYLNNFWVPIKAEKVTYTIADGVITPDFGAEDGDRFYVCGSRRNDGVYTFHPYSIMNDDDDNVAGLRDETFAGTIRVCSVPPALLTLSEEIKSWVASYSAQLSGPFSSESFNGYSYTLKSGRGTYGGSGPLTYTWREQFKTQLEQWRRPCR